MSNPFLQFSAGSGGGDWMTTKKKGQDDAQIKRDAAKAQRERTAARRGGKAKKSAAAKKRKKQDEWIDDDDEEDMEDFVVDDDDEISYEEFSSSEDEEELEIVDDKRSSGARNRSLKIGDSSDSSSEEEDTFLNNDIPKRKSLPPPALQAKKAAAAKSRNQKTGASRRHASKALPSLAKISNDHNNHVSLLSSDEDRKPAAKSQKRKTSSYVEEKKGDDSDITSPELVVNNQNALSKYFGRQSTTSTGRTKKKGGNVLDDDDSSDDDIAVSGVATKSKSSAEEADAGTAWLHTSSGSDQDGSDDESRDERLRIAAALEASEKETVYHSFNHSSLMSEDDEDEAFAHAIKISKKDMGKPGLKRLKKQSDKRKKKKKKRARVIADLSPDGKKGVLDEDEEEAIDLASSSADEEDDQPAYQDQEAREAGSVLKEANALSAQVLQAVSSWAGEKDGGSLPKGIIVDGAVSMSKCGDKAQNHSWISQEEMQLACPSVTLSDYQLIGVNWLALLHGMTCEVQGSKKRTANVNGVLADEMGLGKTVQTIAFLAWLKYQRGGNQKPPVEGASKVVSLLDDDSDTNDDEPAERSAPLAVGRKISESDYEHRPHLIVVPASVLSNWEVEFKKFCPEMNVFKYYGSQSEREGMRDELRKYRSGAVVASGGEPLDVILTPITYFGKEKSEDRPFLRKFNFDYLVIDEAHSLKNASGARYRNLDKFDSSHRLLLTGTPVQNSPKELMALLCFLMPLFSHQKTAEYDEGSSNDGGESMLRHFVSLESQDGRETSDEAAYRKLKQLFAPFVLRRRKADVLHQMIPPKDRKVELVPLDDTTKAVYDSLLATHLQQKGESSSPSNSYTVKQHLFTDLRKAANHPLLLRRRHTSEEDITHMAKFFYMFGYFGGDATCTDKHVRAELEKFSDLDIHLVSHQLIDENPTREKLLSRFLLDESDLFASPKFARLGQLVPDLVKNDHRVLIFSQWTKCLDLLGCLMDTLGLKFLRLDGDTSVAERQGLIDTFNNESSYPVFLLSTRAGGMGINLTAADTCILHDLDFNPFNDEQAESRCHRIGQKKPVTVYKMVTQGTVDEDIYRMQQRKAQMNAAILDTGSDDGYSSSNTGTTNKKGEERKEITNMVQSAVDRFMLQSPESKTQITKPSNADEELPPELKVATAAKPSEDEEQQKPEPLSDKAKDGHEAENSGNARSNEAKEVIEIE